MEPTFEIRAEWAHVSYSETSALREVYGFAGSQGAVNLEGIRFLPEGKPSRVLLIYMHPAITLQLLPVPRAMAKTGLHVLCAASRYARNDTPLIFENVVLDLGAYVRHARETWGYDKVVLVRLVGRRLARPALPGARPSSRRSRRRRPATRSTSPPPGWSRPTP